MTNSKLRNSDLAYLVCLVKFYHNYFLDNNCDLVIHVDICTIYIIHMPT